MIYAVKFLLSIYVNTRTIAAIFSKIISLTILFISEVTQRVSIMIMALQMYLVPVPVDHTFDNWVDLPEVFVTSEEYPPIEVNRSKKQDKLGRRD